jgi:hypothetical protein
LILSSEDSTAERSYSFKTTHFPFSIVEGNTTSWTQWKINCELEGRRKEDRNVYLKLERSSEEGVLSLPSFISLIPCISVGLLHACLDTSHNSLMTKKSLASQEEGDLPENNLQRVGQEQEMGVKGHICRNNCSCSH